MKSHLTDESAKALAEQIIKDDLPYSVKLLAAWVVDRLNPASAPHQNLTDALDQFEGRTCGDCPIPELRIAIEVDAGSGP